MLRGVVRNNEDCAKGNVHSTEPHPHRVQHEGLIRLTRASAQQRANDELVMVGDDVDGTRTQEEGVSKAWSCALRGCGCSRSVGLTNDANSIRPRRFLETVVQPQRKSVR